MQQTTRTSLSPLEIVSVVLCLLYTGCLILLSFLSPWGSLNQIVCGILATIDALAALALLIGARQVAFLFQILIAGMLVLFSLAILGVTFVCRNDWAGDFWSRLVLILGALGAFCLAILHNFLGKHIHSRDAE